VTERGRVRGWYRDPADPTRLRHWSGDGWDGRSRNLPGWSIASADLDARAPLRSGDDGPVLDGPVGASALRPATLPAAAGSEGARLRRQPPPAALRSSRHASHHPASGAGQTTPPRREAIWRRPRLPMLVVTAAVGLAVLVLAAVLGGALHAALPAAASPLGRDTAFVRAADAACLTSMAPARTATGETLGPAGGSAMPTVATVESANRQLDALAARLRRLGSHLPAGSGLRSWLSAWSRYAAARLAASVSAARNASGPAAATSAGTTGAVAEQLGAARSTAEHADDFAVANGLLDCTLLPHPVASYEPIP
jgi:hypothetical protein